MMMASAPTRPFKSAAAISRPLPAAAAAGHHYIKRSTIISCPDFHPPKQHPDSAYMLKAGSISGTSTASHITTTSLDSRPSSAHLSESSHPTSLSSLGNAASHPAMISLPPRIATPQTGLPLPPQAITKETHGQQAPFPSALATLNLPSPQLHLEQAMKAEVVDGFGKPVRFEELIDRDFKTVVIFIRHFRSGYSQRYIRRLSKIANGEMSSDKKQSSKPDNHSIRDTASTASAGTGDQPEKGGEAHSQDNWISANGVKVIVIGHGNYQLIKSYRAILECPFPIYTDLSKDQKVYQLLGMKKIKDIKLQQSSEKQPLDYQHQSMANYRVQPLDQNTNTLNGTLPPGMKSHSEPLVHNQESKIAFLSKVLYNAWRMPWKWSGDPQQLGGELVFEPIRQEKRIKRKPIKYQLATDLPAKSISSRSTSSSTSTSAHSHPDHDLQPASRVPNHPFRRPSCSIKNNSSSILGRSHRSRSVKDAAKEIQVECKFIHRMTNYQDHFSIDELMMMSGIRLTSLIQRF